MTDLKELPHRFARAMETGYHETIHEWVHEDYVEHNPFVPQGIPGVAFFVKAWTEGFTETNVTVEDVIVMGDRVVGRFTFRAKHTGSFIGVLATGKDITMTSIDIWRIKGGKFAEHWDVVLSRFNSSSLNGILAIKENNHGEETYRRV